MTHEDFKHFVFTSKNFYLNGYAMQKAHDLINTFNPSLLDSLSEALLLKKQVFYKDLVEQYEELLNKKAYELAMNAKIKFKNEAQKNAQKSSEFELLFTYFKKTLERGY